METENKKVSGQKREKFDSDKLLMVFAEQEMFHSYLYMGDMILINMKDRRHTGTRIKYQTSGPGHDNAIVNPMIMLIAHNIENIVQFTIDGRPVQFLAKLNRIKASVCVFTDSFLE